MNTDIEISSYPASAQNVEHKKRPKFSKVTAGDAKVAEKTEFQKVLDAFFNFDNIPNMKEHLVYRVIIPGIKRMIMNTIGSVLGVSGKTVQNALGDSGNTDYSTRLRKASDGGTIQNTSRASVYNYVNVDFDTFDDAEEVRLNMLDILDQYDGMVSINDFYDLAGYKGQTSPQDCKYGWTDLRRSRVESTANGRWIIVFPRPVALD